MATISPLRRIIGCSWITAALGCSETPTAMLPVCPPDPFASVVPADTGWRALIQAQAASVPPDTVLEAGIMYRDSVTTADRAVLEAAGAHLVNEVTVIPAVFIRLAASDMVQLTSSGGPLKDNRVEHVEVGRTVCLAAAEPDVLPLPG